ncbi:MAG: hypothetical protein HZR80_17240 [Candidatus Heimdallarchaeota archaeon]
MKLRYPIIMIILLLATTTTSSIGVQTNFSTSFDVQANFIEKISNDPSINSYSNGETVGIIVENALWGITAIQTAVYQYEYDLNRTGYKTLIHTASLSTATQVKTVLQNWYTTYQISGAVLIGNLPYAQFYHPAVPAVSYLAETFICDLYLTDLDGSWTDSEPDGVFDIHTAGIGDIYPEIYLGRIDASSYSFGGTNANEILTLLNRLHTYRTGGVARTHRALTYIDDDWQSWADGTYDNWPAWLNAPYTTRTDVHTPATYTNDTDWENRITQDYEFAHLCAHSGASPSQHYFGPSGIGEGYTTATEIDTIQPTFNFYNLFCCHGADWRYTNCLATTYLFSSSYSIGVI